MDIFDLLKDAAARQEKYAPFFDPEDFFLLRGASVVYVTDRAEGGWVPCDVEGVRDVLVPADGTPNRIRLVFDGMADWIITLPRQ